MTTEQTENLLMSKSKRTALEMARIGPGRVVAKVLAIEPLVASWRMVRAALVEIR